MPQTVNYRTKLITTVNTNLRLVPLGKNNRSPVLYNITTTAAAVIDAESLTVTALPVALWPGDRLNFGTPTVPIIATVADYVAIAATTIPTLPLAGPIPTAAVAKSRGSVYIAGVTDASPPSSPKTIDTTNYLSGTGAEMAITGTNRTLNIGFNRVEGDPGGKLLLDILYIDSLYDREVYAIYQRPNGEQYEGACIPTTGDQSGAVQDKATMTVNLQFQGSSFKFTHAPDAAAIVWPV